jgi:hypothetical protein
MEFIAAFVWPAIAFGVVAYLGWSALPKKADVRKGTAAASYRENSRTHAAE